jgi:bifunctional non-homologous end joining protein LigD
VKRSLPKSRRQYELQSPALEIARDLPGVKAAPFLGFIEPALAELRPRTPGGDKWVHEVKFDGYRFQFHKRDTGTKMYSRRGHDWTERVRPIASSTSALGTHGVILDGEVVILTPEGRSDFAALESSMSSKVPSPDLQFYVFDILYLDSFDLRGCALLGRKRVLKTFLEGFEGPIRYSEHFEADGAAVYRDACRLELEGVVSKQVDGKYHSGRTNAWTKTTCRHRDTFVVAGWAQEKGKFDGLYLGRREERSKLVYAGKLERGFTEADKKHLVDQLERLRTKKKPIEASRGFGKKTHWVKPRLMVDAEFRGKTGQGLLRHPAFKGIRRDLMEGE